MPPLTPEHVVFWNLTTYELLYLGLILLQTGILWAYARETVRLRKTADAQLDIVKSQNETMRAQNETLANQLAASIDEITASRKYEIAKISPLFRISQVKLHAGFITLQIADIKEKIVYDEIRTNVGAKYDTLAIPGAGKIGITFPAHLHGLLIGIRYKRLVDNEEVTVVYSFNVLTSEAKEDKGADFWALPKI